MTGVWSWVPDNLRPPTTEESEIQHCSDRTRNCGTETSCISHKNTDELIGFLTSVECQDQAGEPTALCRRRGRGRG